MHRTRHRIFSLPARALIALSFTVTAMHAVGQPAAERFPAAAIRFLDSELPQMEAAVAARDRDYFEQAMGRMLEFSETWGFKTRANPALARYEMCTDAVGDFAIVGLCRIAPSLDGCESGLAAKFDANLRRCREQAGPR